MHDGDEDIFEKAHWGKVTVGRAGVNNRKYRKKYFDERERFPLIFLSPDLSATEKVFLPERDFLSTQVFTRSFSN